MPLTQEGAYQMQVMYQPWGLRIAKGTDLAQQAGATGKQASTVGWVVGQVASRARLSDDNTELVDIRVLNISAFGRKLFIQIDGACRNKYDEKAFGRLFGYGLRGVTVGERGAVTFTDYKTDKKYRGWRAVSAAITY